MCRVLRAVVSGRRSARMAYMYRMTDDDIRVMVHLRAANAAIFTGRRNSAMRGWRAIRNEMGLQGVLSASQLKKKWHNMKDKYKYLKNPPEGLESLTKLSTWPWFSLMDDAMSGRLLGTAKLIEPSTLEDDDEEEEEEEEAEAEAAARAAAAAAATPQLQLQLRPFQTPPGFADLYYDEAAPIESEGVLGEAMELSGLQVSLVPGDPAAEVVVTTDNDSKLSSTLLYATLVPERGASEGQSAAAGPSPPGPVKTQQGEQPVLDKRTAAVQRDRKALEQGLKALERGRKNLERRREALERDRESLERDRESLERDREALRQEREDVERERAAAHRDSAALERDRAAMERDRACLDRDRAFLDRDRARLDRDRVLLELESEKRRERAGGGGGSGDGDAEPADRELVLQTRLYRSFCDPDLDPAQLESRQRLVALFQRAVEKL